MKDIHGMSILITGGGSGLGAGMARRYTALGARVTICGRREEKISAVAESIGEACLAVRADITQAADRARLVEDHHRALLLWEGLREAGWSADRPETNMVYVEIDNAPQVVETLGAAGIRCFALSPERIRLVTHLNVDDAGIRQAIEVFRGLRD